MEEATETMGISAPVGMHVGQLIRMIRKQKGMRQSELAARTGLKQPNLSRIENGICVPQERTLQKIASALDTNIGAFLVMPGAMSQGGISPRAKHIYLATNLLSLSRWFAGLDKAFSLVEWLIAVKHMNERGEPNTWKVDELPKELLPLVQT